MVFVKQVMKKEDEYTQGKFCLTGESVEISSFVEIYPAAVPFPKSQVVDQPPMIVSLMK